MWPCFQVQAPQLLIIALLLYLLWLLNLGTQTLTFLAYFWPLKLSYVGSLSRWHCREAKKLSRAQLWVVCKDRNGKMAATVVGMVQWHTYCTSVPALDKVIHSCNEYPFGIYCIRNWVLQNVWSRSQMFQFFSHENIRNTSFPCNTLHNLSEAS